MYAKLSPFFLILLLLTGCSHSTNSNNNKPTVTVSIAPQRFFVNQIAGNWLLVNEIIPAGSSPATYEPTPRQMVDFTKSSIYFSIGHLVFEKTWSAKLQGISPSTRFVNTSSGVSLIGDSNPDRSQNGNSAHYHNGINPHIWLSPKNVKVMAQNIFDALSSEYPSHTGDMRKNLNLFLLRCDSLEQSLANRLGAHKGSVFFVYHPVWGYAARDFGLIQIAIEDDGKEASMDKLLNLVRIAKKEDIKTILVQREFSESQARTISHEIEANVVVLNPLGYNWFKTMNEFGNAFAAEQ